MANCEYFEPRFENGDGKINCANCKCWTGECCGDEDKILRDYEESNRFKVYDQMMRQNRGIQLPTQPISDGCRVFKPKPLKP